MSNRTKFTDRARENFLIVLRESCNVSEAARKVGISRRSAYDHKDADAEFSKEWDDAVDEAADRLEQEAWRRGVQGFDVPVVHKGTITTTYKGYSDRMLELLLKAHRPEKYKDRGALELAGSLTLEQLVNAATAAREGKKTEGEEK